MPQNWYIGGNGNGTTAPYAPATFKGSWDLEPTATDRLLSPYQIGVNTTATRAETSATAPFAVCVVRGVSPPLAAGTSAGTIDIILGLTESNAAADFYTKIYAYITQGDSDLVRGVIVDWTESSGGGATEWPTTSTGTGLQSAQAVGVVAIQEGDRLVVELGYSSENTSTTSRTGTIRIGSRTGSNTWTLQADLTVSSTSTSTLAGFVQLSDDLTLSATVPANLTPETATDMAALPYNSGNVSVQSATYALWWKRTGDGSENGYLGTFAGVDGAVGNYIPQVQVREADGSDFPVVGTGYNADFQAYQIPIAAAGVVYLEVYSTVLTNPPGRDLVVSAIGAPTVPADNADDYFITDDFRDAHGQLFAVLIDKASGAITGLVPDIVLSENGVVADNGVFVLSDKEVGSPTENQPVIYDTDFSLIAAVTGATLPQSSGGEGQVPVATDGTNFYCAQAQSGLGPGILVSKFDQTGAVLDQWTLPVPAGWTKPYWIAVSRDGAVLYYSTEDATGEPIKRWDLTLDAAMADFLTAPAGTVIRDLYILRDGTLIFIVLAATLADSEVRRYTAVGVLSNTYTFADPYSAPTGSAELHHIAPAQDDPDHFAVWFQQENALSSSYRDYVFLRVTTATGATSNILAQDTVLDIEDALLVPEPDEDVSATYFGAAKSCPLMALGARAVIPPAPDTEIYAIRRLRRAPHLSSEQLWQFFSFFQLDIQAGVGTSTGQGADPQLMLRWSDDGGFTWSNEHWVSAGKIGEYSRRAIWRRLGRGRDRVFEVTMSDPVLWVLLDAYLQAQQGTS